MSDERDTGHLRDLSGTCPATGPEQAGQAGHTPIGVSRVPPACPAKGRWPKSARGQR